MTFSAATMAQKVACCAAAETPKPDYEKTTLCDPATGAPILVITAIDVETGLPTSLAYNVDGTAYADAISGLTSCDTPEVESDPVTMCDDAGNTFLRWFIKRDGVVTGSVDTSLAGLPYAPVGVTRPGACSLNVMIRPGALNIASGAFALTHDPDANGATFTFAPAEGILQSFSVDALECGLPSSGNTITVVFGTTTLYMVPGQSKFWSIGQESGITAEMLEGGWQVVCSGNSAAAISWTVQV